MILSIQYLRAVAAFMVLLYHLHPQLQKMGYVGWWPECLSSGVDIFFVISGFVMALTTMDRPITPLQFYKNRIARIVPLYWLLTSVMVAFMLAAPSLLQTAALDWRHVIFSYLFIPSPHPVADGLFPVIILGWTLNLEMFFYLLFGALLLLPSRGRYAIMAALLGLLALAGTLVTQKNTLAGFYTSSVVLEFAYGLLIALAHRRGAHLEAPAALGMLVAGALALIIPDASGTVARGLVWGLPSAMIVFAALSLERRARLKELPLAHLMGDASYSLYLSHGIILAALSVVWRRLGLDALPGGWILFMLCGTLTATAGGLATYWLMERPVTRLARRLATTCP